MIYVHGKNASSESRLADYGDLKMTVQPPNSAAQRSTSRQQIHGLREAGRALDAPRRVAGDQKAFYETDASEFDETSTTLTSQPGQAAAMDGNHRRPSSAEEGEEEDESDGEYEDQDEDHPASDPLQDTADPPRIDGKINSTQAQLMLEVEGGKGKNINSSAFGHLTGDTYPSTTSGHQSTSGSDEKLRDEPSNLIANGSATYRFGNHQSAMRRPLVASNIQNSGHARQPPHVKQEHAVLKQEASTQVSTEPERAHDHPARSGPFAYQNSSVKPPLQNPGLENRTRRAQPRNQALAVSSNSADNGSKLNTNDAHHYSPQAHLPSPTAAKSVKLTQRHAPTQDRRTSPALTPEYHQGKDDGHEYGQLPDTDLQAAMQQQSDQQADGEEVLDHELHALLQMDYQDVRDQDFDAGPNDDESSLPSIEATESLIDKLAAAAADDANGQTAFFASLPIDQWEEAGEWFLDQFAEIVGKLKSARQEKRKAAHQFEDEIERRHDAIGKKRKLTEAALEDMKINGSKVLQGTPKKAKT